MKLKFTRTDPARITIQYSITSYLAYMESGRYRQKISGMIFLTDDGGKIIGEIGKISADKLLLDLVHDNKVDEYEVFDIAQYLGDIQEAIQNEDGSDWNPILYNIFDGVLVEDTILILNSIELLPRHRGSNLGHLLVKDLYNNFSSGAGLFIVRCNPLQQQVPNSGDIDEFTRMMCYADFDQDYENALKKLIPYFKMIGLKHIPALSPDLLFMSTGQVNRKFAKVKLT